MKTTKIIFKAMCIVLALAIFTSAAPLTAAAAATGPYGAEDYTYEDFLYELENYSSYDDGYTWNMYFLDREGWDTLVAITHEQEEKIIRVTWKGTYEIDWMVLELLIAKEMLEYEPGSMEADMMEMVKETDEHSKWYASLPYSEQMRILNEEWEIHGMGKDQAAEEAARAAAQAAKPITLKVNGTVVKTDSPPVIENGRTLAPLSAAVEPLGYLATWDSSTQTVAVYEANSEYLIIVMTIGSNVARVSVGSSSSYIFDDRILETPPKLINGRTMVPVRFIAETLGCKVEWDQTTKTISIVNNAG